MQRQRYSNFDETHPVRRTRLPRNRFGADAKVSRSTGCLTYNYIGKNWSFGAETLRQTELGTIRRQVHRSTLKPKRTSATTQGFLFSRLAAALRGASAADLSKIDASKFRTFAA